MPRIRTIKPEFWSDIKIVRLSFPARLFFIACWNFADDHGWLQNEPDQLKLRLMPNDDVDAFDIIEELHTAGLIEIHICKDGHELIRVKHFLEHQRVSHPSPSTLIPESSRILQSIPEDARRLLAVKSGIKPDGKRHQVTCSHCGLPSEGYWTLRRDGKPAHWVVLGLSVDLVIPLSDGGTHDAENLVLACVTCNKSRGISGYKQPSSGKNFQSSPEDSRILQSPPESSALKGREGKGKEGKGKERKREGSERAARFVPPSLDEVRQRINERNLQIDPVKFLAYYEARGWKLSKGQPVRNWDACLTTWETMRSAYGENGKRDPNFQL